MSQLTPDQISASEGLTCGIELEGRFRFHNWREVYKREAPFIKEHPITPCNAVHILASMLEEESGLAVASGGFVADTTEENGTWSMHVDESIKIVGEDDGWFPFELTSRILNAKLSGLVEIAFMLKSLEVLGDVQVDDSTGLHVHVGAGFKSFSLRTLQNVAAITAGFERQWMTLHSPDRQKCEYCEPFSEVPFGYMSAGLSKYAPGYHRIAAVLMTPDWPSLLDLVTGPMISVRPGVNFRNAVTGWATSHNHRTIEFRQHEGTFEFERIRHWLTLCVGIMLYASTATDEQLQHLFSHVEEEDFTVIDLLWAMGCSAPAHYYQSRTYGLHKFAEKFQPSAGGREIVNLMLTSFRPSNMQIIEETRERQFHKHVERAVLEDTRLWRDDFDIWVPFDAQPYTMNHKTMMRLAAHKDRAAAGFWRYNDRITADMPQSSVSESNSE